MIVNSYKTVTVRTTELSALLDRFEYVLELADAILSEAAPVWLEQTWEKVHALNTAILEAEGRPE